MNNKFSPLLKSAAENESPLANCLLLISISACIWIRSFRVIHLFVFIWLNYIFIFLSLLDSATVFNSRFCIIFLRILLNYLYIYNQSIMFFKKFNSIFVKFTCCFFFSFLFDAFPIYSFFALSNLDAKYVRYINVRCKY